MILVDIYVPVIDDTYDFRLDENAPVGEVMESVEDIISKKMKNSSDGKRNLFTLYSAEQQRALDKTLSLYANGIRDGGHLMLI